ncbi:MAG: ATP-binding protein [Gemmatimonadota bacterium]
MADRSVEYSRLYRRFVAITFLCAGVPLLLLGWGINQRYAGFATARVNERLRERVEEHRKTIDLFIHERSAALQMIAQTHTLETLSEKTNLSAILQVMNDEFGGFTDLGVIDETGNHLVYSGPYDLMGANYAEAVWFHQVLQQGLYVSDMFMGFRRVPHFVIAVSRRDDGDRWVLRATIDQDAFRSIVESVQIGRTGEVYLLNGEGVYQTQPRFNGDVLSKASYLVPPPFEGIEARTVESEGSPPQIVAHTWLDEPPWLLVVGQDHEEAFGDVEHVKRTTQLAVFLSALFILLVSVGMARYMIRVIRTRDIETHKLDMQLMQAGKMASMGELSAGVAHEINNPLAIIMTETQILSDRVQRTPEIEAELKTQLDRSLSQIGTQIKRCKTTTQNLLRFSRRTISRLEDVNLNAFLTEAIELLKREAGSSGIKFLTELDASIPAVRSDPSQLQQVFLNLLTNAIDAHDTKPYGTVRIKTSLEEGGEMVRVSVADTGTGIRAEHLDHIFEPFFTTKPVGKGTGLGLSICYSIVVRLGGDISVRTEAGEGTEFSVRIPIEPSPDLYRALESRGAPGASDD